MEPWVCKTLLIVHVHQFCFASIFLNYLYKECEMEWFFKGLIFEKIAFSNSSLSWNLTMLTFSRKIENSQWILQYFPSSTGILVFSYLRDFGLARKLLHFAYTPSWKEHIQNIYSQLYICGWKVHLCFKLLPLALWTPDLIQFLSLNRLDLR